MGKKNYLESLRGLAALSVAFYHLQIGSMFNNAFTDNAPIMVDFFFVLSGYVISLNYFDRMQSVGDLIDFQKKRFWRIYPLHFVMLLAFVLIEIAKFIFESRSGVQATDPAFSRNDLGAFLQHVFLVHNVLGNDWSWNGPSWSISAEFYTYFVFALVLVLFNGATRMRYAIIGALLLMSAFFVATNPQDAVQVGLFRCLLSFFIGSLAFEFERAFKLDQHAKGSLIAGAIMAIVVLFAMFSADIPRILFLAFPLLCAALILGLNASHKQSLMIRILESRFLVYLGTISFGVYMIHSAVWWAMRQALRIVFKLPTSVSASGEAVIDFGNAYVASAVHILGIALVIALAHISYNWLEAPLSRRFRGARKSTVSVPASSLAPAQS